MNVLSGLKPEKVFYFFEELTKIPRGSYNEKAVSDYIAGYGRSRGLEVYQDELYNVIIIREASSGREDEPALILQGHIDMVNEKTSDSDHDFEKDPLDIYIDGDHIRARGTTLGADDGIAVAYMLAILDDDSISAPRLEMVFTVSEEVGMDGAYGIDVSRLKGRLLINIDSEEEGILLAGCAGGMRAEIRLSLEYCDDHEADNACGSVDDQAGKTVQAAGDDQVGKTAQASGDDHEETDKYLPGRITISGLLGGHSGSEIDKQRINADHTLACILLTLYSGGSDIKLKALRGGGKDNAIPFEACAEIYYRENEADDIQRKLTKLNHELRNEYRNTDGGVSILFDVSDQKEPGTVRFMTAETARKALGLILAVPNGIVKMSGDIDGLVETSLNLGVMRTEEDELILTYALRSSVDSAKRALGERVGLIAENYGAQISFHGAYPAWEYREKSVLRDKMVRVYEEMYGRNPEVTVIHAGVECGLFAEKLPGLDAISFGPDMYDVHTVNEHLSISSAARMYEYLVKVIES